jgi:hypothetical protein
MMDFEEDEVERLLRVEEQGLPVAVVLQVGGD